MAFQEREGGGEGGRVSIALFLKYIYVCIYWDIAIKRAKNALEHQSNKKDMGMLFQTKK